MMHRYFVVLSLAFFVSDVYAHKDREVVITEGGKLIGLPEQYLPAHFMIDSKQLQIGRNSLVFPECVSKYFLHDRDLNITLGSSWYHKQKNPPPYIYFDLKPKTQDFSIRLNFALDTLDLLSLDVQFYGTNGSVYRDGLAIYEKCRINVRNAVKPSKTVSK
ncbi:MAG: hypothetical protein E6Q75_08485 [Rheinheimera sp.]|nr:MAG: hypothetical protein E6Q75_08485 [Rheinheimera sp.]